MKKAGWILSGLASLFLLLDAGMKQAKPLEVVGPTVELGWPESTIVGLGVVLLTGHLGGAVATHVRVGGPVFNIAFPVVFGCLVWGGLWLRDERVRPLLPLVSL